MSIKQIANAKSIPSPADAGGDGLGMFREIAEDVAYNANGAMPKKSAGVTPTRRKKKKAKPDPRGFRWQVRVWLDANKPDQLSLGKWIHELKLKRTFAPILRNALSLYRDLMEGQVDMLYQLFPDVKPAPPIITPEKLKEMEKEIGNLRIQVDILIKQQSPAAVDYTVKMASAGEGAPVRTPRPSIAPKPAYVEPSPVVEADTSEAFLNGF